MTYEIKQKINNTSIPPTVYDNEGSTLFDELIILRKNGKYGINHKDISGSRNLLPFEFDNISMAGFSLYLLIKNGKMGLAHIKRIPNFSGGIYFELLKLIPCEYDFISFPTNGESFVLMRKDSEKSSHFQIYFTHTKKVSDPFWRKEYVDRDFIAVTDNTKRTVNIFHKSGSLLFTSDMECFVHAFESEEGTIFVIWKKDRTCMLLLFKKIPKSGYEKETEDYYYKLTGENKVYECKYLPKPVFAPINRRTHERGLVLGFIIEKIRKHHYINGNLEEVSSLEYKNYSL